MFKTINIEDLSQHLKEQHDRKVTAPTLRDVFTALEGFALSGLESGASEIDLGEIGKLVRRADGDGFTLEFIAGEGAKQALSSFAASKKFADSLAASARADILEAASKRRYK